MSMPFIKTPAGVTFVIDGKPMTVSSELPCFEQILAALKAGDSAEVQRLLVEEKARLEAAIAQAAMLGETRVSLSGGAVLYDGEPVTGTLVDRMLEMLREGFDILPMARFLDNLMQNPSYRAQRELYSFLEHGQCPITEDGHFMAYKAVNHRFYDIHSDSFDNSVGQVVSMPRHMVDDDPTRTCSAGLHVCSYEYLPHFARGDNGHIVLCKVNPRDVVAIPKDYNDTKMRCCAYEVVGVVDYVYKDGDSLGGRLVYGGSYVVTARDEDGVLRHLEHLSDYDDAGALAEELSAKFGTSEIRSSHDDTLLAEFEDGQRIDDEDDEDEEYED